MESEHRTQEELRAAVDDVRDWLCQPNRMKDAARKAANLLFELVGGDVERMQVAVDWFISYRKDDTYLATLEQTKQYALEMARAERRKRAVGDEAERSIAARSTTPRQPK